MIFSLLFIAFAHAYTLDSTLLFSGEAKTVAPYVGNPGNRVLKIPSRSLSAEGRLDYQTDGRFFGLVLRPRAIGSLDKKNGTWDSYGSALFQEAYLKFHSSNSLWFSAGRIQFGWGPAESISPSNWTIPEIQWQPSPYFETPGIYRAQMNLTLGQNYSLILLQEFQPLKDHYENYVQPDEVYKKRALLKSEWSWNYGSQILGLTFGRERLAAGNLNRAGLYGSITASDAWQFYLDAVARETKQDWKSLSVVGARYTFENGIELRGEGIFNQAGLKKSERLAQEKFLSLLSDRTLFELAKDRSQSLLGKKYLYFGFRWANPPALKGIENPVFFVRSLYSLDHSASLLAGAELGFRGRYTLSFYGAKALGAKDGELGRLYRNLVGIATKVAF